MARRGASRGARKSTPALLWLFIGLLMGLALAWYLAARGYIAQPSVEQPQATTSERDEPPIAEDPVDAGDKPEKSRYDFFTVLPEMEVVVPEQELANRREPESATAQPPAGAGSYLLQVGSFRSADDADQLKARLALMGIVAQVQTVTVNDATWHRVRVGPVQGAREADKIRRQLQDSDIDSLVMKNP
ncbi:SPOR domain-containing protein [Elongatibacter sediminis]|uniref:SPOR domain-containing protein n=1 Tax=Elongatibacter sediminis TaxID=3119006 RepID=A0AAW9RBK1_9GAMM